MKKKVFLSHSFEDKIWVEEFAKALDNQGVETWHSLSDVSLSEDITKSIEEALRSSSTLVMILSSHTVRRSWSWLFFELGAAVADKKLIIPVIIDETGQEELPLPIAKYQYLREKSPVVAAEQVVRAIKRQSKE